MATLDTSISLNGNVEARYLGARGMPKAEQQILAISHRKAVDAVVQAHEVLTGTRTSGIKGAALGTHFKLRSGTPSTVATITANLAAIKTGLTGPLRISDVNQRMGEGVLGYVTVLKDMQGAVVKRCSIHVEFRLLTQALRNVVAMTIIHEASHKFCGTEDHAYAYEPSYQTMGATKAVNNADSYAFFAWSIYLGHVITANDALAIAFKRLQNGIL